VRTTEHDPVDFYTVADDRAAAMPTSGGQSMNGTFETVEGVLGAVCGLDDERLVVIISANLAFGHDASIRC